MVTDYTQKQSRPSGLQSGMNSKHIYELFLQLEDDFNLFELRVNDIPIWERLRFDIHRKILTSGGTIAQPHSKVTQTKSRRIRNYSLFMKEVLNPTYRDLSSADILIFGHARRKKMENGTWWDIYFDPLIEALNRSYVYMEKPYLGEHHAPTQTDSIVYLDKVLARGQFLAWFRKKFLPLRPDVTETLEYLREEIQNRFGVDIDLIEMTKEEIANRECLLISYSKILNAVQPKVAVVVVSYGRETFIEACKINRIPVVELQHGIVTPWSVAYSYPGVHRRKETFPDYFFTFGDFWTNATEYPIRQSRVCSVGFPYFDMESSRLSIKDRKKQIIFLSQGTVGKEMSRMAVELRSLLSDEWKVVYKLHPGEYDRWKTLYPWLIDASIIVVDDDSIPLYSLLSRSLIQVGVASTAIYEGLGLGTNTIILDLPGSEYMMSLIDRGFAIMVDNAADLFDLVDKIKKSPVPSEEFFKPKALENMKIELESIINKQSTRN